MTALFFVYATATCFGIRFSTIHQLNDMKWESKDVTHGFSLSQLLDQNMDQKKKFKKISLSKSRSNPSSQKHETLDSLWKTEQDTKIKLEAEEVAIDKLNVPVKSPEEENTKVKIETFETKDQVDVKMEVESQQTVKNEEDDYNVINIQDTSQIVEDIIMTDIDSMSIDSTINCPICDKDLSHIKSSYFRQKHVEECISSTEQQQVEQLEYDNCVFCGKYLKHFNAARRELHINRCLDSLGEAEAEKVEETYAGQRVPFLNSLEICPVCHEFAPFVNRQVKQKITHIKQCSKRNNVSLPELLKKFQWIGWGHLPVPNVPEPIPVEEEEPPVTTNLPKHEVVAYIEDDNDGARDADFSERVFIHKRRKVEVSTKQQDKNDEELQTVLAISRSMKEVEAQSRRKERIRPSDERDWNAANIISMEESRLKAISKLDKLLFPAANNQLEREKSVGKLGPSRIPSTTNLFYWHLPSNSDNNWNNSDTFITSFLSHLTTK